jgi:hypothetical protein
MLSNKAILVTTAAALLISADAGAQSGPNCSDMPDSFNRSIGDMVIRRGRDGYPILDVTTHLDVRNTARQDLDLSYDLIVRVNEEVVATLNRDALFRYGSDSGLAKGAITCAITCSSECGSIFGDGTCSGCNCNYGFTSTLPLPTLEEDDVITVELQAVDGSRRDEREDADNRMSAQFLGLDRTLARLRSPAE